MSFIVKNSQLSNESIQLLNLIIEQEINAAAAFKLSRILKNLSSIVEDKIASEKKIWDKWVQKDESGNPLKAKDEAGNTIDDAVVISNVDSFTKEMNDLMSVENEIPFEKLKFEELGLKTVKIKDLIKIDFLFDLE